MISNKVKLILGILLILSFVIILMDPAAALIVKAGPMVNGNWTTVIT